MTHVTRGLLAVLLLAGFANTANAIECGKVAAPATQELAKPHVNVVTIGGSAEHSATLLAAISMHLSQAGLATRRPVESILKFTEDGSLRRSFIEYSTQRRHYAQMLAPTFVDYSIGLLSGSWSPMGAVLVVSTVADLNGVVPKHLGLLRDAQVPCVVAYLEGDARGSEAPVRGLLSQYGYPGSSVPVVLGSAAGTDAAQSIEQLLTAIDRYVPVEQRAIDAPFLMDVEDVVAIAGRGTVATGRIKRGRVSAEDAIEIVGLRPTRKVRIVRVEMFRKALDRGQAGDKVSVMLGDVNTTQVERGQVLAAPGSIQSCSRLEAAVILLSPSQGGRNEPAATGYRPQLYFRTTDVTATVTLPQGVSQLRPGEYMTVVVELSIPVALEKKLSFVIREGGRTVGVGMVTQPLQCSSG